MKEWYENRPGMRLANSIKRPKSSNKASFMECHRLYRLAEGDLLFGDWNWKEFPRILNEIEKKMT